MKALEWWQSFSKNSHCDLDLDPIMLKCELFRGIVISNTCVKLYWNWIINGVARAGEHTNQRTYSHTYVRDRLYIPSTTLLCEGIIITIKHSVIWMSKSCKTKTKNVSGNICNSCIFSILSRARLFKTNDIVSQCFVKISNISISYVPIFFVEKMWEAS